MINWHDEFERLYRERNPTRLPELKTILQNFTGYEECLWLAMARKYSLDRTPNAKTIADFENIGSAEQRVIRMYAHYAPEKLPDVPNTVALMRRDGPGRLFSLLVKKYGDEPPVRPATYHERLLVLYATYNALDRVNALPALLKSYEGMEDVLMRRVTSELGPEPHTADAGDPREPRERLRRICALYNPDQLKRVDALLARYKGNELQMFAMLQRQYGREPSEYDVQAYREKLAKERAKMQAEHDRQAADAARAKEAAKAKQDFDIAKKMLQVGATMWDVGSLMTLEPLRGVDTNRPESLLKLRDQLMQPGDLTYDQARKLVTEVFRSYERELVPYVDDLLGPRFDASETGEFLALLDCNYANAVPGHLRTSLRTVVSLLEMKHGSALEEIWVAGGVERFLARIDPQSRDEWVVYLTMLHGSVTEAELQARNRLRAFYLHYNPGTPLAEVDNVLSGLGADAGAKYAALCQHYGPEPEPIPVDVPTVQRILAKYDPDKLSDVEPVIEAHCLVGDDADTVIKRIERTYGPLPKENDDRFADLAAEELHSRFQIFSNELRLRLVIGRKKTSLEHPELDVLSSIIHGTPQYHDAHSRRLQEEAAQQQAAGEGPVLELMEAEEERRALLIEQERSAARGIVDMFGGIVAIVAEDANNELTEMLKRHLIHEDEALVRAHLKAKMLAEEKDLAQWLQGRLIWRAKWQRDEQIAAERKRNEELRQRMLRDAEEAPPVPVVYSDTHVEEMARRQQELHEQAARVLRYNSTVHSLRHGPRDLKWQSEVDRLMRGDYHAGCVFHRGEYVQIEPPSEERSAGTLDDDLDDDEEAASQASLHNYDWEALFLHQCHDYVRALLQAYEPLRLPLMGDMLREHFGREYDLVAALEQQYNVQNWRARNLRARVEAYYRRVAPERASEIPELLDKYGHLPPEMLWEVLRARHKVDPEERSPSVRQYLVNRLRRYFARCAPQRLPEAETLVRRCPDYNCDSLFSQLVAEYGPEDPDQEFESIRLKLLAFYRARRMAHVLPHAKLIAKRFVGRQALLQEIIRRKFGASLDDSEISAQDVPQH